MKRFASFCLAVAVVVGASVNTSFSCGGSMGGTGCKVATLPLTIEGLVQAIRWLEIVIP